MQRITLGAELAEVGRVVGIAPDADDTLAGGLDDHATADAAVAADAARLD
jgi:hypothetical protein